MIRGQLDYAGGTIAHLSALLGERMCDVGHSPGGRRTGPLLFMGQQDRTGNKLTEDYITEE